VAEAVRHRPGRRRRPGHRRLRLPVLPSPGQGPAPGPGGAAPGLGASVSARRSGANGRAPAGCPSH
jgi:hypothetical protein